MLNFCTIRLLGSHESDRAKRDMLVPSVQTTHANMGSGGMLCSHKYVFGKLGGRAAKTQILWKAASSALGTKGSSAGVAVEVTAPQQWHAGSC